VSSNATRPGGRVRMVNSFDKRLNNLFLAENRCKDPGMKRIWKQKQLDLVNQRKERAYERMVERARSVH